MTQEKAVLSLCGHNLSSQNASLHIWQGHLHSYGSGHATQVHSVLPSLAEDGT